MISHRIGYHDFMQKWNCRDFSPPSFLPELEVCHFGFHRRVALSVNLCFSWQAVIGTVNECEHNTI